MMNKFVSFINRNFYDVFLVFLIVLNVLPFLAPIFMNMGWKAPASLIYHFYSFFCHQFHWRSLHIHDHQCAWCTRDTFIWGAILTVALIVKFYKVRTIKWYWMIPFMLPMAIDGGLQTIATLLGFSANDPLYMSTNLMRMATGGTFGVGLGLWMMPLLKEVLSDDNTAKQTK